MVRGDQWQFRGSGEFVEWAGGFLGVLYGGSGRYGGEDRGKHAGSDGSGENDCW